MIGRIISRAKQEQDFFGDIEYFDCIRDLIGHEMVKSMQNFIQHGSVNCLEHSLYVSYCSYLVSRRLRLDYHSTARGGLLHDFFLYDWHDEKPYRGLHGLKHPRIALGNANQYFQLNYVEKDIIIKHMWPLTLIPPKFIESFVVIAVDKYCAFMEVVLNRVHPQTSWILTYISRNN